MGSSAILDIDALTAPLPGDNACGVDARENPSPNSDYQMVKNARNMARTAERNHLFDSTNTEADDHWRKVLDLCPKVLREQSKDLEVASWLTEAQIRKSGFAGLRDSILLLKQLIDVFWENLYPIPDEYGIETRVAPLAGLNGEGNEGVLIAPIRNARLTEGESFSYWQYQQATEIQRMTDEKAKKAAFDKLGFSMSDIEKAIEESSQDFIVAIRDDIKLSIETYQAMGEKLDELCGAQEAPPTKNITNILKECLNAIEHLGRHKFPVEAEPVEEQAVDADQPSANTTTVQAPGAITNREQAFKQIEELANYFRKHEPHSPISYVLEKAVKWGHMPLNELIQELIPDNSSRGHFSQLTGVNTED